MKAKRLSIMLVSLILLTISCTEQKTEKKAETKVESKVEKKNEIFSVEEADKLFGEVIHSQTIKLSDFQNFLGKTDDQMMFKFVNNEIMILDGKRMNLTHKDLEVDVKDVFSVYSKSMIEELLKKGKSDSVIFEQRKEVFSIRFGNIILEKSWPCPPFC